MISVLIVDNIGILLLWEPRVMYPHLIGRLGHFIVNCNYKKLVETSRKSTLFIATEEFAYNSA